MSWRAVHLCFAGPNLEALAKMSIGLAKKAHSESFLGGLLITLEGIEGSGKSTQMRFIQSRLSSLGIQHVCSREPGGTSLCADLRALLLAQHPSGEKWDPLAELLLFSADRAQHLETVVRPALKNGKVVVLDRFEDSTRAYQGAQGVPQSAMSALGQIVLDGLRPDLTLLLDADPERTLGRAAARNKSQNGFSETRFDSESLAFHTKVREEFLRIARQEPSRVHIVNGEADQETVANNVWAAVSQKLGETNVR
jgi:dTMP kinase